MSTNFDNTNKLLNEIQDVISRTVWVMELEKKPTKIKSILSRLIFGKNFECVIKDK